MVKYCPNSYKKDTKANTCQYGWTANPISQINLNLTHRTNWVDLGKIVGNSKNTYAYATYKKVNVPTHYTEKKVRGKDGKQVTTKVADAWKTINYKPYVLAISDFGFEIPQNAHIYQIKFRVWYKVDKNVNVLAPAGNFRLNGKGNRHEIDNGLKTGWSKGSYVVVPSKKLSNKVAYVDYVMDEKAFVTGGYATDRANYVGLDLLMQDASFKNSEGEGKIYVEKVMCVIEYDMPKPSLKITNPVAESYKTFDYIVNFDGTSKSPYIVAGYNEFPLIVRYSNKSKAKNTINQIKIGIPWGSTLEFYSAEVGTYDPATSIWTFNDKANANYSLELRLRSGKQGLSNLNANKVDDDKVFDNYYYYVNATHYDGLATITINPNGEFHKRNKCCVDIELKGVSNDNSLNVYVSSTMDMNEGSFELIDGDGIILNSQTSNMASFNVPNEYEMTLRYCFYPLAVGDITLGVYTDDDPNLTSETFKVLDAYEYNLNLTGADYLIKLNTHRIASDVGTDSVIIPCVSDEVDKSMIMSDCQINMSIWEKLDYIGCIPLKQTHFDPESTFKDKLLDSHYKNKKYMGKELAVDEDISLNVRLHPRQVTTLQGLIELDKPIPINANHKCFEGDSLNHRGWCEIYGVKTKETNPHWYKCNINVKYLTHNLNTRFKIDKGVRVSDYNIPSLMSETHPNGANLSDTDGYFIVDTDGTFYYASDYYNDDHELISFNDAVRNSFSIDNGQHIRITSKKPLSQSSIVSFNWSSILIDEDEENSVSRIIRLIQKGSNKTVFEYQYDDLRIGNDEVTGNVIYRRVGSDDTLNDYPIGRYITFRYTPADVSYEDDTVDVETDSEIENVVETGEAQFGSTFKLSLNNNVLSFVDEGFNGREINVDEIKLEDGEYYFQVEWINNNDDFETPPIETVFDFNVQDTILTTTYSQTFNDLIVSPFPVSNKNIVFTREAEEGTIYYYKDDGEEFSYLVDPYYQYHCGTDLIADGNSVFDINYGYEIVYIQNGLVRLGFNRLTGEIYLGKYDVNLDEYVTTHRFHLEKFDDANVNMISDDKIEIQVSDSVFTIYRGHPYIKIKHELEDIYIDTVSERIWGEQVGDSGAVDEPAYWDLMNSSNLLDNCVGGGQGLKSSCVITESVDVNSRQSTSLDWMNFPSQIMIDTETTFTLIGTSLEDYVEELRLDDNNCSFGSYTVDVESDGNPHHFNNFVASKNPIQIGDTVQLVTQLLDIDDNPVGRNYRVDFYIDEMVIGYGYTNEQGVAILEYDSNGDQLSPIGYTGTSVGEVDLKAKFHDDINLESVMYHIIIMEN